jgi:hypothetical protein
LTNLTTIFHLVFILAFFSTGRASASFLDLVGQGLSETDQIQWRETSCRYAMSAKKTTDQIFCKKDLRGTEVCTQSGETITTEGITKGMAPVAGERCWNVSRFGFALSLAHSKKIYLPLPLAEGEVDFLRNGERVSCRMMISQSLFVPSNLVEEILKISGEAPETASDSEIKIYFEKISSVGKKLESYIEVVCPGLYM